MIFFIKGVNIMYKLNLPNNQIYELHFNTKIAKEVQNLLNCILITLKLLNKKIDIDIFNNILTIYFFYGKNRVFL